MKLKKITLDFPEPLTRVIRYQGQAVTQEEILFADLSGIREKLRKELSKILKGIDVVRKFGLDFFQVVTVRVEGMQIQLECMMAWRRDENNPCVYYVYYPMDAQALLQIKDMGSRLPLIGRFLKGKDLKVAQILQERKLIEAIRRFSLVEMKIDPKLVIIEVAEIETEAAQEAPKPPLPPEPVQDSQNKDRPS